MGLSVVVGAFTGLVVAGIHEAIVSGVWGRFVGRHTWWVAGLPVAALLLSTLVLEAARDRSNETTEAYIRVFHEPRAHIRLRSVPMRLAASVATIGLGGSMGLEGPSIYAGAAIGDFVERRMRFLIVEDDRKLLLVAGAAAGIAAIFKAPVTGIVFALEVPYRDDLARRALIPAMIAAASGYVVFASIVGTTPLFPVAAAPLRLVDLAGSLLVGLACGLSARIFIRLYRAAIRQARTIAFGVRALIGGVVVGGVGAVSFAVFHRPFALGPGYEPILRAARGQIAPGLLVALIAMKMVATTATSAGNGVGGLFFPSVLMGAALGGALGHVIPGPSSLFAVVGIAAFLGGAYKVPLAGVAFVAETTGAPGYIIPGLVAAAIAYIASGRGSLSHRQRFRRVFDVDTRLDVAVSEVMSRDWVPVPPTATLQEVATRYAIAAKARTLPVLDDERYLGLVTLATLGDVPSERWGDTQVTSVINRDAPTLWPSDKLGDALTRMRKAGVDRAVVLDHDRVVGTVQTSDIVRLEEILDAVADEEKRGLEA